jgi:hypothetical protein
VPGAQQLPQVSGTRLQQPGLCRSQRRRRGSNPRRNRQPPVTPEPPTNPPARSQQRNEAEHRTIDALNIAERHTDDLRQAGH